MPEVTWNLKLQSTCDYVLLFVAVISVVGGHGIFLLFWLITMYSVDRLTFEENKNASDGSIKLTNVQ